MNSIYKNDFEDILIEFGYVYISGEYVNSKSKLKCLDKDGYIVYLSLDKLINTNKIPRFVDSKNPSSIENINKYLMKYTNGEYLCVSKDYTNNKSLLDFVHIKCGRTFKNSWINVGRGRYFNNVGKNKTGAFCPFCDAKQLESTHALVLKQVWLYEHPDTIVEDKSCINPNTQRILPTDIVNHRLQIAIEIQSWFHDFHDQKKKDIIKKNFWISKGYKFYAVDQRDYSVLDMIKLFFPQYNAIPEYIDFDYSNKINDVEIQNLLNNGAKVPEIAKIIGCTTHNIYDAIQYGRISYPENYINARKQPLVQLDMNGNFVKEYDSISLAIEETGSKYISSCLQNGKNFSNGYYWIKKEDYYCGNYKLQEFRSKRFLIPVDKYDMNENFIKHYNSIIEAGKDNNCPNINIYKVITGEHKQCKGFLWKAS
jgi:hypothetical protein